MESNISDVVSVREEAAIDLQTQIASLQSRVKELEAENAKLSAQLANCRCNLKVDENSSVHERRGGCDTASVMSHHPRRYVALKVMYFGQRFYGFASEAQMDPTVESELFKAFEKTRLLIRDKKELQYSRCGRTDKGVSAVGQVISLFLRSKLKNIEANDINSGESIPEEQMEAEIDYVRVLNRVLPKDIRVLGWCPVPNDFGARFSCLSREYKYFFWSNNLNLSAMEMAGKKFVGEHDFRNFCKMDALNVHNYKRFEVNQLCAIRIKGSAFLWHQVRCMVAVLFMIGQGLEAAEVGTIWRQQFCEFWYAVISVNPLGELDFLTDRQSRVFFKFLFRTLRESFEFFVGKVIDVLLDTERTPRKPQYSMATEIPLVLRSCEFEGLKFTCSEDAGLALRFHLENECQMYQLQAAIFQEALLSCLPLSDAAPINKSSSNNGTVKKKGSHVPLMSRPTEPSYEERRSKLEA